MMNRSLAPGLDNFELSLQVPASQVFGDGATLESVGRALSTAMGLAYRPDVQFSTVGQNPTRDVDYRDFTGLMIVAGAVGEELAVQEVAVGIQVWEPTLLARAVARFRGREPSARVSIWAAGAQPLGGGSSQQTSTVPSAPVAPEVSPLVTAGHITQ